MSGYEDGVPAGVGFAIGHSDLCRAFAVVQRTVGRADLEWWIEADRLVLIGQAEGFACEATIRFIEPPIVAPGQRLVFRCAPELLERVLCGSAVGVHNRADLSDPGSRLEFRPCSTVVKSSDPEDDDGVVHQLWRIRLGPIQLTREFQHRPSGMIKSQPRSGKSIDAKRLAQLIADLLPFAQPDRRDGKGALIVKNGQAVALTGSRMRRIVGESFPGLNIQLQPRVARLLGHALKHFVSPDTLMHVDDKGVVFDDGRVRCRVAATYHASPLKTDDLPEERCVRIQSSILERAVGNVLMQVRNPTGVGFQVVEAGAEGTTGHASLVVEVDLPGQGNARATCRCTLDAATAAEDGALPTPSFTGKAVVSARDLSKVRIGGEKDGQTEIHLTGKALIFIHTRDGVSVQDWLALERAR